MAEDHDQDGEGEASAAEAFEALQAAFEDGVARLNAEVAALRQAMDVRLGEPLRVKVPDYTATLADLTARMERIERKPTPRVDAEAVASAVGRPLQELREVSGEMQSAARTLRAMDLHIRTERQLRSEKWWWGGAGVAIGVVAWVALSGPIARRLPASWAVPEKMVAATVGKDRWTAGQLIARSAHPAEWAALVAGADLEKVNRAALDACEREAERLGKAQRCVIKIDTRPATGAPDSR